MSTFKAVILKGGNHLKNDGTSNVKIRITHNRKADYISTDLYVGLNDINNASGIVISGPNKDFLNYRISSIINTYILSDLKLGDKRNLMTVKEIKSYLVNTGKNSDDIDFFSFCDEFFKTVRVPGTLEQYESCVKSLKSFTGNVLPITEINYNFLLRYEHFLRNRGVKNGIVNYMRTFRSLFNKCRDNYNDDDTGKILIPNYPFKKYKIPKRTTDAIDHCLTLKELRKFISYTPSSPGEEFAKDMFMLMFLLIGIESKDLFYCTKPKKGRIEYIRFKTGRKFSILVPPEALTIISKYSDPSLLLNVSRRFELPKSFFRQVNNYLSGDVSHDIEGIFSKLGITTNVTTKWARHTWATIARNECRIDKADVALCLGHVDADNRVTDMYVRYNNTILDSSNRKVIDKVFNVKFK